jgi:PAS domain S-box-containing protein
MLFLDNQMRVRRYTGPVKKFINLIASDEGRPITDLVVNLKKIDLVKEVKGVMDDLVSLDKEVETADGRKYLMRIIPYRTMDNHIDGVVMTFMDTSNLLTYAENIINTVREPLIVLDKNYVIVSANRSFYSTFHVTPEETENKVLFDLGNHQWDIPELHDLLERILPENTSFEEFRVEHEFQSIGRRVMSLNARKIQSGEEPELILLAIEDLTDSEEVGNR